MGNHSGRCERPRRITRVRIEATAHKLRPYAWTAWFKASGQDILTTARPLRHASIQTKQIYAAVDPARPTEVVNLVPMTLRD